MLIDAQVYCMTSMIYLFRPPLTAKAIYRKTAEAKFVRLIYYDFVREATLIPPLPCKGAYDFHLRLSSPLVPAKEHTTLTFDSPSPCFRSTRFSPSTLIPLLPAKKHVVRRLRLILQYRFYK